MRFVEEVVVESFLPTYRSMLAEALRERGLTQSEVAEALGISQSAVSKYVHGQVATDDRIAGDDRVGELVERTAEGLAEGETSRVGALVEAEVLIRELEGDLLATLHEEAMPELREHDVAWIHDPDSRLRETERVLASVRRGLRVVERTGGFAGLIPNVGSNLVECIPDPTGVDDVAGVPGRIFDVKGRATIPAEPEFGVSEHVARVLLAARDAGCGDLRAALNLRYDRELIDALEAVDHRTIEFDAEAALEPAIADALAVEPDATVLYQTGAHGIEPIVYLLGSDAPTVAGVVREIE